MHRKLIKVISAQALHCVVPGATLHRAYKLLVVPIENKKQSYRNVLYVYTMCTAFRAFSSYFYELHYYIFFRFISELLHCKHVSDIVLLC